jgi:hypothetical protein
VGGFGNAVVFDTNTTFPTNVSSTASATIRAFRTVNTVYIGDIYWHINSGRVFRATVDRINTTTDSTFVELTNNQGFLDLSGILNTGTTGERIEFSSTNIKIYDSGNRRRVILGAL